MKVRNKNTTKNIEQSSIPQQVDTSRLPVDPDTHQPILPGAQPGYYPGFSTLSQQAFWDEATRNVVLARVQQVPPIRFFSASVMNKM